MSKTSNPLFPGEYSETRATQNLNDLVKESNFHNEAYSLAVQFKIENDKMNSKSHIGIDGVLIDRMTNTFTLCNEYETRYQAIIKKALDEALAKVRAKNDLNSIVQDFIPGYDLKEDKFL